MNSKHFFFSLILVFCSTVLIGQQGITEGSTIMLNEGIVMESQREILPKFTLIYPAMHGEEIPETINQRILVSGKIDNHEDLELLMIHNKRSSVNENGYFHDSIILEPGIQEIRMRAYFSNTQIDSAFAIEYVTPMMMFARETPVKSKYFALIIGIEEYSDMSFPTLYRPVKDANEIYQVLTTRYTFEVDNTILLKNTKQDNIESVFETLTEKVGPDDNLLIFFAGHSVEREESRVGYWIPSDAVHGRYSTYFRNSRLVEYIRDINAKHTLVISDACMAGSLFTTRAVIRDSDKDVMESFQAPSCKAMTSASFKETDDRSVFAKFMIEELSESDELAFTSRQLYRRLYNPVKAAGGDPSFGNIMIDKDRGGEFVFIRKQD